MPTRSTGSNRSAVRALVGLLSVALLGLVPVAFAGPAHAADETTIDATISKPRAYYRESFSIRGTAGCVSDSHADGDIELLRRKAGSGDWQSLGTQPAGAFAFDDLRAVQNATYALRYPGSVACAARTISTNQKVNRRMPTRANDRLVFSGSVKPAWKRKPVIVQVKKGKRWVKYAQVRTNAKSRWSKKVYARRSGNTYFRAYVKGTRQFQRSYSGTLKTYYVYGRSSARASAE